MLTQEIAIATSILDILYKTQNSNGGASRRHYYFGLKVALRATFNPMVLALELLVRVQGSQVELAEVVALRAQVVQVVALSVLPQDC
jgi:hypothetical protein